MQVDSGESESVVEKLLSLNFRWAVRTGFGAVGGIGPRDTPFDRARRDESNAVRRVEIGAPGPEL